jgi:hypothetical protein
MAHFLSMEKVHPKSDKSDLMRTDWQFFPSYMRVMVDWLPVTARLMVQRQQPDAECADMHSIVQFISILSIKVWDANTRCDGVFIRVYLWISLVCYWMCAIMCGNTYGRLPPSGLTVPDGGGDQSSSTPTKPHQELPVHQSIPKFCRCNGLTVPGLLAINVKKTANDKWVCCNC